MRSHVFRWHSLDSRIVDISELVKETIAFRAAKNPKNPTAANSGAPSKDSGKDKKKKGSCNLI